MKRNIIMIMLGVRAVIIFSAVAVILCFWRAYESFTDSELAGDSIRSILGLNEVFDTDVMYVPYFQALRAVLMAYLVYALVRLYQSLDKLSNGQVFYDKQAAHFKRAGAGIIIFAKCNYLLFVIFGAFFFHKPAVIFSAIPEFLGFYLGGNVVLVIAYLAERGSFLKEETELTI